MTNPDIRMKTQLAALVGAIEFRNNPKKMAEYIRRNREYFPKIDEKHLKELEK